MRSYGVLILSVLVLACHPGNLPGGPPLEGDALVFDDSFVHEIEIEVAPSLVGQLVLSSDVRIPCNFTFDGFRLENVGIRLKGQIGSGREMSGKAQFSVKFDEFVSDQRLHGLKKLILNNEVQDPGFTSRRLSYEIWRNAGVPVPRTAYAHITFNGEYFGLYTIEEAFTNQFLKRWFEDNSGNLYEGDGADVTDVNNMDLDTNEEENDRSDLVGLAEAIVNSPDETLLQALEDHLDIDQFMTYWAVERLVYQWDGYGTILEDSNCCSPNNYYIYHDPSQGRFVFMPRGTDGLFRDPDANVGRPPRDKAQLAARLFALPEGRALLAAKIEEILDTSWDTEAFVSFLDRIGAQVLENFVEGGREETTREEIKTFLGRYKEFILVRPERVRARLAQGL